MKSPSPNSVRSIGQVPGSSYFTLFLPLECLILIIVKWTAVHRFIKAIILDTELYSATVHTKYTVGCAVISVYLRQGVISEVYYMFNDNNQDDGNRGNRQLFKNELIEMFDDVSYNRSFSSR